VVSFDKSDTGFGSAYVRRHLGGLREVIWGHPPDDPHLELGDLHWVHLQAAWYSALAECRVRPALGRGQVVLADTWTHKFQAKLALRPRVDLDHVRSVFSRLPRPDLVIHLRVDPAVAARRKGAIAASEAGNHEGPADLSVGAFVAYQQQLAGVLDDFATDEGWAPLEVTGLSVAEVAEAVARTVRKHVRSGADGLAAGGATVCGSVRRGCRDFTGSAAASPSTRPTTCQRVSRKYIARSVGEDHGWENAHLRRQVER
jgi:thymidylate kinase